MTLLEWGVFSAVCGALVLLGFIDKSREARRHSDEAEQTPHRARAAW